MRNRLAILTVAAVLPLVGTSSLAVAAQAGAADTLGQVTLSGTVDDCDNGSSPTVVKIKAVTSAGAIETKTDNSLAGSSNSYSVVFKKIPKTGATGKATVTCEDDTTYKPAQFTINGAPTTAAVKQKQNLEPQ
ncbi:hypothetical protein ABZT17_08050 [Streptomyces sp. NPDC005648]|uniref:hypothetical protein n=1 Tax=Streptomyces sp. NPDC005648 TaxID=3157044 RepID=UPI0033AFFC4F